MRLANQTTVSHEACPADWPFPTQLFIVAQHSARLLTSTKAPPGLYPVLLLELENSHHFISDPIKERCMVYIWCLKGSRSSFLIHFTSFNLQDKLATHKLKRQIQEVYAGTLPVALVSSFNVNLI
jgi:hypothetical protein